MGTAGSVNSDAYSDIIIGAPDYGANGQVFIYHGSGSGLSLSPDQTITDTDATAFGTSVGTAGLVNDDTYADIIIGALQHTDWAGGAAFVFHGSASGIGTTADWEAGSTQSGDDYGSSVGTAGDVNGDTYDDVIVGAPKYEQDDARLGQALVYHGSASGLSENADWTEEGEMDAARFGNSASTAGDVNGDGYDDVIIGAYQHNNNGRAYVFQGSADGLEDTPIWTADGSDTGEKYAYSVAAAGDVEGDGLDDIIVGASEFSGVEFPDEGAAYVYSGTPDMTASNDGPKPTGETVTFTASMSYETGFTYGWDFDDGNLAAGNPVQHTYGTPGTYAVTVQASNTNVTVSTVTYAIIQDLISGLSASNDGPTELGDPTTFNATITEGTNVSYEWDFDDGNTSSEQNPSHTYENPGVYEASVTASNLVDTETTTTTVYVDESITGLSASNDGPTELGDPTSFSVTIATGTNVTYEWDFDDGNTSSEQNPTHTYAAAGTYIATVTATNSRGEESTTTTVYVDVPLTGLSATNDSPTALGEETTLSASVTGGTNPTYEWDLDDGSFDTGATVMHEYGAVGTYTATVTVSNSLSELSTTTTVTIERAISGLSATNDGPTELGSETNLSATITAGSNPVYEWDFGDGETGAGAAVAHTYDEVGEYTATVTVSNSVSEQSTTTTVTIVDVPISGLTATNDGPTLNGNITTMNASVTAGTNVIYEWDFDEDGETDAWGAEVVYTFPGIGQYTVTVTAHNGSTPGDETTTVVEVIPHKVYLPLIARVSNSQSLSIFSRDN